MTTFRLAVTALAATLSTAVALPAAAQTRGAPPADIACPSVADFRGMLDSGQVNRLPNFQRLDGFRVQMRHLNTDMTAHAKYHATGNRPGMSCTYSNYVGMVGIFFLLDADKAALRDGAYWRKDFRYSSADQERGIPGETIDVCMENRDGIAYPSVGCTVRRRR